MVPHFRALYTDIKRPLPSRGQLKVDLALCGRCCVGAVNRKHVANKQANVRFFSALPSSGFAVVCLCTGQTRGLRTIYVRYFREAVPKNHKLSDEEGKLLAYYVQLRDALNTATHVEDEPAEKSASRTQGLQLPLGIRGWDHLSQIAGLCKTWSPVGAEFWKLHLTGIHCQFERFWAAGPEIFRRGRFPVHLYRRGSSSGRMGVRGGWRAVSSWDGFSE